MEESTRKGSWPEFIVLIGALVFAAIGIYTTKSLLPEFNPVFGHPGVIIAFMAIIALIGCGIIHLLTSKPNKGDSDSTEE